MNKKLVALAALGGCVAWAASGSVGPTKVRLDFTKPALPPPASMELRAGLGSTFVALPVEIGPLAARAEQQLPEQLAVVHDWLNDAACAKRTLGYECNTARLDGTIVRNGPVEMQVAATTIELIIPVKYDLTATGLGWASQLSEHKSGTARLVMAYVVGVNATTGLDVTLRDGTPADGALTLLKGNLKLARLLDARLKPVLKSAEDDLRRALAALPVKTATARAWNVLASPLELGEGSGIWLKGAPEYYAAGGFASEQGRLTYRVAIASRPAISEGGAGPSPGAKRQPTAAIDTPPAASRIRMAVPIDLEAMRQVAEAAFDKGQIYETRADRFSEPVKVKVLGTRVYPALRQIGLELNLEVTDHKGNIHTGKLNLAGRPVLDAVAGTVTLADVTFPPVASSDGGAKSVAGRPAAGQGSEVPRLGSEPFASMFTAAARLDVASALAAALPRAAQLLNQRIDEDVVLTARFKQAQPVSVETAGDGVWLLIDMIGEVALVYDTSTTPAAAGLLAAKSDDRFEATPPTRAATAGTVAATAHKSVAKRVVEARRPTETRRPVFEARHAHEVKPVPMHEQKLSTTQPQRSKIE